MASQAYTIKVKGLVEFQRALREADKALPRELKRAMDTIATKILLPLILAKMEAEFVLPLGDKKDHRHRSGKLRASVRAVSQQRAGIVKEGVAATPYAGWWEFGGSTHSSRGMTERKFVHEGRTLYPSLYESTPAIALEMDRVLGELHLLLDSYSVSEGVPV